MKILLILVGCFSFLACSSQVSPVDFHCTVNRSNENHYTIVIKAALAKGWRIYAGTNEAIGTVGITVDWENENITRTSQLLSDKTYLSLEDPLFENKTVKVYQENFVLTQFVTINGTVPYSVQLTVNCFAAGDSGFVPVQQTREVLLEGGSAFFEPARLPQVDLNNPVSDCGVRNNYSGTISIFLLGFGGGLLALLTPCIFPMIPVTVSYFTGKAKTKQQGIVNGIFYGASIFMIYTIASIPFHLMGNIDPQIFNIISTNAWVNVLFFLIFMAFALSLFGLFEIKLPSSLSNAAGEKSGIFFMSLTLVVVSFSCTGIILGTLLVNALSATGNAWQLTAGMAGFGAALALPFGLFAMFPHWLQQLPKSGAWLNTVKKVLAFVELALAVKFLSNADLVEHWGVLKREVFIALWILIASGLALYLLGVFNKKRIEGLQNADKLKKRKPKLSYGRIGLGIVVILFVIYLLPGILIPQYGNLKLLSGFAPPLSYSIYGNSKTRNRGPEPDVINDYEKAIALAKQLKKPLLIDFTGWACVNCRKMEELVWIKPDISQLIKDQYILVSLYVDDRKKLPDGTTVGKKWADFEAKNFQQVTQPLYVALSPDGKLLNNPIGYSSANEYKRWLECGVKAFQRQQSD